VRRRFFLPPLAASLLALPASARAEPLAPRLVRILDTPGHLHPLADRGGRIPVTAQLPPGRDAASFGLLPVAPGIGAARLAPDDVAPFAAAHPELFLSITPRLRPLLDVSGQWIHASDFRDATGGVDGTGVIVGVIDTGIDVSHPDFRDATGKTRIAWMLTGGSPKGLHPEVEKAFGCTDPKGTPCAIYDSADIDAMIQSGVPAVLDPEGHGTHVASIAAGNGGPMITKTPRYVGVAPGATLVVAAPSGGSGFYDADILNAARFIFDRADAIAKADPAGKPHPAVINLSVGGDYGSHDGQSSLEKGLTALVGDDKPGRAIVIAAGNSGALLDPGDGKGPYGTHTEVHVAPHEETRIPVIVHAAQDGQAFVWITFRPGDDVSVALEGPDGSRWVGLTGKGDQGAYGSGSGATAVKAGVVNNLHSANEAISPDTNSAAVVWTGHWSDGELAVVLRGQGDASLWVTGTGDASGSLFFARSLRQGTINVPGSAPALLAVGCSVNRVSWKSLAGNPIELTELGPDLSPVADGSCYFSSDGPTPLGAQKPEISAPGGFVAAAMSVDADPRKHTGGLFDLDGCPDKDPHCAVVDDHHALATGTSMSAPHVAGAVALLMALDPTLTQARVTAVLQAGARRPTGHVPDSVQLGPGLLDLEGARAVLLGDTKTPPEPDPSRSWYTLSSAFARPDPTWPVWGTIELRRLDGSIAAVDGSKLALAIEGGTLYRPLSGTQPGMWRFAVAGKQGDTGGVLRVEVSYDGISLGATTLPVGNDAWTSLDPRVGAASAACAGGAGRTGGAGAALLGLAAAALHARRRRARR
jgi:subtilisin family serine protease